MEQGEDFRRIVFRMAEASQPHQHRWLKLRETVDTMILGTLSTSVGVVVLIIGLQGVLANRGGDWRDLWSGMPAPSSPLAIASIAGEGLGLAGLALGKMRGGAISPLSAVGTVVCLIHMYLFFGRFIFMQFY